LRSWWALAPAAAPNLYARTFARHIGRHIPGNPKLIPQNMPGAGSLKAVNYLYNVEVSAPPPEVVRLATELVRDAP